MLTKDFLKEYNLGIDETLQISSTRKIITANNSTLLVAVIINSKDKVIKAYRFENEDKRNNYIQKLIDEENNKNKQKLLQKEKEKDEAKKIQIGDIFVAQHGYEANFCEFAQIIDKKDTKIKIKFLKKFSTFDEKNRDMNNNPIRHSFAKKDNFSQWDTTTYTKTLHGHYFNHGRSTFFKWKGNTIEEYNDH